jgi:hypothetical protein
MMSLNDEKIRRELIRAYQMQPDISISDTWQQNVMREIRRIGPLARRPSFLADLGTSAWRLAPVAGIVLILLIAGGAWFGPSTDTVLADLFLMDPVDFVFGDILRG